VVEEQSEVKFSSIFRNARRLLQSQESSETESAKSKPTTEARKKKGSVVEIPTQASIEAARFVDVIAWIIGSPVSV
jgi:hypothetical protein